MQRFRFLLPPYTGGLERLEVIPDPVPLGTIAVDPGSGRMPDSDLDYPALHLPLSVPLLVLIPPETLAAAHANTIVPPGFGRQPALFSTLKCDDPREILRTVNTRPPPPSETIASWFALRLKNPSLDMLLTEVIGRRSESRGPSVRSTRRHVRSLLECCLTDLQGLLWLAKTPRLAPSIQELAFSRGTDPARLRERVARGLGVTLAEYNQMPGWEWPLEAAIRNGLGAGGWGLAESNLTRHPRRGYLPGWGRTPPGLPKWGTRPWVWSGTPGSGRTNRPAVGA